jgi:SAM-dependent methyltransferase
VREKRINTEVSERSAPFDGQGKRFTEKNGALDARVLPASFIELRTVTTAPASPDLTIAIEGSRYAERNSGRLPPLLVSSTIVLGAFLLFLVEPLFAKLILPWFGGSAAVWAMCLVFFQTALLVGYLYAHLITRLLIPSRQSIVHIALLLASLLFLPIAAHSRWRPPPGSDPTWRILALLTASIGLPFFLLSATGPLLQAWYARERSESGPYHLYALSNLASLLALLSFPSLIEPRIPSHRQALLWSALFAIFVVLCSLVAWIARRSAPSRIAAPANTAEISAPPALHERLLWLSLSACGSMLLLSVTNHLTENVAPVPLLWILPLALYLLTFALAFNRRSLYSRWLMVRLLAVTLGSLGYAIYDPSFMESIQVSLPFFCVGLFCCCFFCHGELAKRRPAASHLTSFYLMISLGGALGAMFVGLLAPHIFSGIYEFPLALSLTALLGVTVLWPQGWLDRVFWTAATVAMAFVLVRNVRLNEKSAVVVVRNFYGALRVKEAWNWLKEPYYTLYHGKIEHGAQFLNAPRSLQPTTYYGPDSGIGLALERCCGASPKRVGMIGLGAGTVAAYGKSGDYFGFYEINPQVVTIARNSFRYLRDTPAKIDIVMGDARLSLESEPPQQFDVFAVDAFSGDAIPVHLLTKEAFALYLHHLKPEGILVMHTSNTYLDLAPVVQLLANDSGYPARWISNDDNLRKLIDASDWVLVTRNQHFLDDLDTSVFVEPIVIPSRLRIWTDDYNNLFQILRPVKFLKRDAS